jgi:carotenoid cleavage dioxygenase-like enzyme
LRLDLKLGKIMANEPYYDPECEFPTIAPLEIGRQPSALYLSSLATPKVNVAETFDSIARLDLHHGGVTLAQFGQGCYPSEPLYVSDPQEPDQGWIVTVVFDGHQDQSTVQIFSAQQLDMGPIGVLELPEVIPLGFHGTWRSAA